MEYKLIEELHDLFGVNYMLLKSNTKSVLPYANLYLYQFKACKKTIPVSNNNDEAIRYVNILVPDHTVIILTKENNDLICFLMGETNKDNKYKLTYLPFNGSFAVCGSIFFTKNYSADNIKTVMHNYWLSTFPYFNRFIDQYSGKKALVEPISSMKYDTY